MKKIYTNAVVISLCLIALGVFFKFLVEPIYNRYKLSSCLGGAEKKFEQFRDNECSSNKENNLNYCLRDAQTSIYCRDESHREYYDNSPNISGSLPNLLIGMYKCEAPDNSTGYWNDNTEYQQLATKCEQKINTESCVLSSGTTSYLISDREKERSFCFKQY